MNPESETSYSFSLIDQSFSEAADLNDRGLNFGDGVFETMLFENGSFPLLKFHLDRLNSACSQLQLNLDDDGVRSGLKKAHDCCQNHRWNSARIKIVVTRAMDKANLTATGSYPSSNASVNLYFSISKLSNTASITPVNLISSPVALHDCEPLAGIKHTNRLPYIYADLQVNRKKGEELLFSDIRGNIIETMHHNVLLIKGVTLLTPTLDLCGVKGVMRRLVLEALAKEIGFEPKEKNVEITDLESCEGVIICNALRGFSPVLKIDGKDVPSSEAVCKKLNAALANLKTHSSTVVN